MRLHFSCKQVCKRLEDLLQLAVYVRVIVMFFRKTEIILLENLSSPVHNWPERLLVKISRNFFFFFPYFFTYQGLTTLSLKSRQTPTASAAALVAPRSAWQRLKLVSPWLATNNDFPCWRSMFKLTINAVASLFPCTVFVSLHSSWRFLELNQGRVFAVFNLFFQ